VSDNIPSTDEIKRVTDELLGMSAEAAREWLGGQTRCSELEKLAVALYDKASRSKRYDGAKPRKNSDAYRALLREVLRTRKNLRDGSWFWTEDDRARLLAVSGALTEAFRAAYDDARSVAARMETEIAAGDFLTDYEIEIRIQPHIILPDSFDEADSRHAFSLVLCEPIDGDAITYSFGHSCFASETTQPPIYLDTAYNWNIEDLRSVFPDDYVGYVIHALGDHGTWSYADIVQISGVWSDVRVTRQNHTEIGEYRA
jgi:hypothetical protein